MTLAKIYTIENQKGGVGKSTTAGALAVGLAARCHKNGGGNVLLIDLDPQGDAARSLGINPNGRCISKVLLGNGGVNELKENVMPANREDVPRPNLYILPASDKLASAKVQIVTKMAGDMMSAIMSAGRVDGSVQDQLLMLLEDKLAIARQAFKYIIIDCPPTLDMLQQAVHHFADAAIVPVKLDFLGTGATTRHTESILADQTDGIDIRIKAVVPTFYHGNYNLTQAMLAELEERYGRKVIMTPIPNTIRVAEAPAVNGLTIFEYAPNHPAAEAYWDLVDYIKEN